MATQAMSPMAGFNWLMKGINLGRNNPKAIFGGTALLLLVVVGAAFVSSMAMGVVIAMLGASMTAMMIAMALMMVAIIAVMAVLLVGYLRLIHAVESNRPARATDVFGGFSDLRASLQTVGFFVLLMIVQNVLVIGIIAVLAADVLGWYGSVLQASVPNPELAAAATPAIPMGLPDGFGLAMLVMLLIGLVSMGVQAIGLGQIALRGASVGGAFGDGLAGAFKNLLPLLVQMVALLVAALVASIVMGILMVVVGVLANLVGTWLMVLVSIPLYVGFMLVMYVVMFGMQYHCWRDICGDDLAEVPADALTA